LREALERLGGRGGGRGNVAQGGSVHAERLDEALARAADAVRAKA
jgi:alanyl-tRNA synthetase